MIRYLETVFYLKKIKIKPKFGSVWAVFFGREGGTEPDSWHQEPVAVTFIQQVQIPHLSDLILDYFF